MKSILWITLFGLSQLSLGATHPSFSTQIQLQSAKQTQINKRKPSCHDGKSEKLAQCIDAACDELGSLGCRSDRDLDQVTSLCQGQFDGSCFKAWCSMPHQNCRFLSTLEDLAISCEEVGGPCVKTVCSYLGQDCHFSSGPEKVGAICEGLYDGACINTQCERLGKDACRSEARLKKVANRCKRAL